jgi:pilus assembly protein Flp/PilA
MLKFYVKASEALKSLRADQAGVVSFEYVVVAFCVVAAIVAAFGTGATTNIQTVLTDALSNVLDSVKTNTGG